MMNVESYNGNFVIRIIIGDKTSSCEFPTKLTNLFRKENLDKSNRVLLQHSLQANMNQERSRQKDTSSFSHY